MLLLLLRCLGRCPGLALGPLSSTHRRCHPRPPPLEWSPLRTIVSISIIIVIGSIMFLMYHTDAQGQRVYTLQVCRRSGRGRV